MILGASRMRWLASALLVVVGLGVVAAVDPVLGIIPLLAGLILMGLAPKPPKRPDPVATAPAPPTAVVPTPVPQAPPRTYAEIEAGDPSQV